MCWAADVMLHPHLSFVLGLECVQAIQAWIMQIYDQASTNHATTWLTELSHSTWHASARCARRCQGACHESSLQIWHCPWGLPFELGLQSQLLPSHLLAAFLSIRQQRAGGGRRSCKAAQQHGDLHPLLCRQIMILLLPCMASSLSLSIRQSTTILRQPVQGCANLMRPLTSSLRRSVACVLWTDGREAHCASVHQRLTTTGH